MDGTWVESGLWVGFKRKSSCQPGLQLPTTGTQLMGLFQFSTSTPPKLDLPSGRVPLAPSTAEQRLAVCLQCIPPPPPRVQRAVMSLHLRELYACDDFRIAGLERMQLPARNLHTCTAVCSADTAQPVHLSDTVY